MIPTSQPESRGAIHIIDDDDAVRRAVALLLQSAGWPTVTHVSGLAFLDALPDLREASIGCVLTDVRMPGLDGISLLKQLRTTGFAAPVVVMTAHGDVATAVQAMKCGAADFIEKPFDGNSLLVTIDVAQQNAVGANSVRQALEATRRLAALSAREREVLDLLVSGKPTKLVAQQLGISQRTVEVHRARLLERLGVSSLAEAVRLAVTVQLAAGADGANAEPHQPVG